MIDVHATYTLVPAASPLIPLRKVGTAIVIEGVPHIEEDLGGKSETRVRISGSQLPGSQIERPVICVVKDYNVLVDATRFAGHTEWFSFGPEGDFFCVSEEFAQAFRGQEGFLWPEKVEGFWKGQARQHRTVAV